MRATALAAAAAYAAGAVATAQTHHWTRRMDNESTQKNEVALAVHHAGTAIMVAWHNVRTGGQTSSINIHYAASNDGANFGVGRPMLLPPGERDNAADPMVVFSDEGIGILGSIDTYRPAHFWMARKEIGQLYASEAVSALGPIVDKGFLVASPPQDPDPNYVGVVFSRHTLNNPPWCLRSLLSTDMGTTWPAVDELRVGPDTADGNQGGTNGAVILRYGPNAEWRSVRTIRRMSTCRGPLLAATA